MRQRKIPAAFIRGGTSNAIVFKDSDLPQRALWDEVFLAAMGTPDPNGRQLNGMGGGISSLSKVCVVGLSDNPDADIDYTFAQIGVRDPTVGYNANCGNMSAAMGPFAVDEGLVEPQIIDGEAMVRVLNTNTNKILHAYFDLDEGMSAVDGDYELKGVAGTGAPVRMAFQTPGGALTGKLLPTGNPRDTLDIPGLGKIEVSMVDAANTVVAVHAETVGMKGTELPEEIDANRELMDKLELIRSHAGVVMGFGETPEDVSKNSPVSPFIGFVSPAQDAVLMSGDTLPASAGHLTARIISSGNCHRALPLTCTMCTATASRIDGTIQNELARTPTSDDEDVIVMHGSGFIDINLTVYQKDDGEWFVEQTSAYRTQRRLFDGQVYMPVSKIPNYSAEAVPEAAE
ncbi:MAG TPA: PrpF family protein [Rhodospirillaceae bacterium]|nr:PrpF family protein [Rhodospirillaceae bacterium]HAT36718.1 PrpF family protein [Rhodospirillaceae bacterium]